MKSFCFPTITAFNSALFTVSLLCPQTASSLAVF